MMLKKILCMLITTALLLSLCGCWNYRGLDELSYVAGLAIDRDIDSGIYKLTYELVDLSEPAKGTAIKPMIVVSEGKTIFDAIRNAKMRLENKLYFGNDQIIIIGKTIAEVYGLNTILDMLFRGSEIRETANLLISEEGSAADLLLVGDNKNVVSYHIQEIIKDDAANTGSIVDIKLYQAYSLLHSKSNMNLVLPIFHIVENDKEESIEADGIAVFDSDKVIGHLTPLETKYFLFAMDEMKGGALTYNITGGQTDDVTLEINQNHTQRSFSYENNEISVTMKVKTRVYLTEMKPDLDVLDPVVISELEQKFGQQLKDRINDTIRTIQNKYDSDILGIGDMIYKKDPKLWTQLSKEWKTKFQQVVFLVDVKVSIINTASRKKI